MARGSSAEHILYGKTPRRSETLLPFLPNHQDAVQYADIRPTNSKNPDLHCQVFVEDLAALFLVPCHARTLIHKDHSAIKKEGYRHYALSKSRYYVLPGMHAQVPGIEFYFPKKALKRVRCDSKAEILERQGNKLTWSEALLNAAQVLDLERAEQYWQKME